MGRFSDVVRVDLVIIDRMGGTIPSFSRYVGSNIKFPTFCPHTYDGFLCWMLLGVVT